MYRVTLILILSLLLPDLYIYLVYIVKRTRNLLWRGAYWVPSVLLTFIYIYYIYLTGANAMSNHPDDIGRLAIAVMLFAVPKITLMLCSVTGILLRGIGRLLSQMVYRTPFLEPRKPFVVHRKPFTILGIVLGTISFGNILYGSIEGITRFEVKEVEYRSPRVPEGFDGYRIVQLSDLHLGSWQSKPEAIEKLVQIVNDQHADLIVFTGDLVNQQSRELDKFHTILARLKATDGVYSVLGNHDYGTYYRWKNPREEKENLQYLLQQQRNMGWRLLNNECLAAPSKR